jgi:hypothetical protein
MHGLREPEHITLVEGLALLQQSGLSADEAKVRLRQAFVRKAFPQAPLFAFEYDEAEIDWATGLSKFLERTNAFARPSDGRMLIAISLGINSRPSVAIRN